MSDLDKAIRDDLAQRARETAPEAADRSMVACADAIRSVLDWARWLEADNEHGKFAHLATTYAQQIRLRIARELSVSSQDTPAPRPAREWKPGDTALWRGREVDIIGVSTDGSRVAIDDLGEVLFDRDVTELSESPSPQGGER